jgi:hypothetical protein
LGNVAPRPRFQRVNIRGWSSRLNGESKLSEHPNLFALIPDPYRVRLDRRQGAQDGYIEAKQRAAANANAEQTHTGAEVSVGG